MHVPHRLAELGPGLPSVFDELHVRHAVHHLAHGIYHWSGALIASGGNPELEVRPHFVGDLDRGARRCQQVLECAGGAERANSQHTCFVDRAIGSRPFQMVNIRQMKAGRSISGFHPSRKPAAVGGDVEVPDASSEIEPFADEPHGARIGLKEAEIRMAVNGELRFREFCANLRQIRSLYPWSGDHYVAHARSPQTGFQVGGAGDGPDVGGDTVRAQCFCSVERRDAQSDMAHRAIGGEIFICQSKLHLPRR
jgi:hypothetical protein